MSAKNRPLSENVTAAIDAYRETVARFIVEFHDAPSAKKAHASENRARASLENRIREAIERGSESGEPIHEALNSGNGTYKP